jgi:ketosteroid isomerase-like protein
VNEDNEEIVRLTHRLMRAVQERDMDLLEELLGDDFTLTTGRPGAEVRSREQWLWTTERHYRIYEFSFDELAVQRYGDCAVVRSRYRQKGVMGRSPRNSVFRMTDLWVLHPEGWQIHVRHAQPIEGD